MWLEWKFLRGQSAAMYHPNIQYYLSSLELFSGGGEALMLVVRADRFSQAARGNEVWFRVEWLVKGIVKWGRGS